MQLIWRLGLIVIMQMGRSQSQLNACGFTLMSWNSSKKMNLRCWSFNHLHPKPIMDERSILCKYVCICWIHIWALQQEALGDWQTSLTSLSLFIASLHVLLHQVTIAVRLKTPSDPVTLGANIYPPSETPAEGHVFTNAASMSCAPYLSVSLDVCAPSLIKGRVISM